MRFTCPAAVLAGTVGDVARAVPSNPTQSMYSGIQIAASRGRIRLTAADDAVSMIAGGPAAVEQPGEVLVGAEPMTSWLQRLPGDTDVTVDATDIDVTIVASNGATTRFPARAERLPAGSWGGAKGKATGVGPLRQALQAAQVVTGADAAVRLRTRDGAVCVDATDRYRVVSTAVPATVVADFDVTVPLGSAKLLGDRPLESVEVVGNRVRLVAATAAVTFQTTATAIPDVDPLLASRPPHEVTVSRDRLVDTLGRMQLLVGKQGTVEVEVAGNDLVVSVSSEQVTGATERVPIHGGPAVEARLLASAEYLLDAVRTIDTDDVVLAHGPGVTFVHLTGVDGGHVRWIAALRQSA